MPKFKFTKRVKYDAQYEPGQIVDHLPKADTDMLQKGGYGDYVESVDEAPAPVAETVPAEGSNDSVERPTDPQPERKAKRGKK